MAEFRAGQAVIRTAKGLRVRKARRSDWTEAKQARFLDVLAETASARHAAAVTGVSSSTAFSRRRRDPVFEAAWDAALSTASARLQGELLARSLEQDAVVAEHATDAPVEAPTSDATRLALLALQARRVDRHRSGRGAASAVDTVRLRREITERLEALAASLDVELKR